MQKYILQLRWWCGYPEACWSINRQTLIGPTRPHAFGFYSLTTKFQPLCDSHKIKFSLKSMTAIKLNTQIVLLILHLHLLSIFSYHTVRAFPNFYNSFSSTLIPVNKSQTDTRTCQFHFNFIKYKTILQYPLSI